MLKEKRPKQPPQQPEPACDPLHSLLHLPFSIIPSRILCKSKHFVQIVNVVRPSTHTSNNNNKNSLDYNNSNNKNCGNKGFRLLHAF